MMNFKQEELIDGLLHRIREKFPEVVIMNVTESPEDPASLWINVTAPKDEDRETALIEFASDKATDILLDYGYHLLVMPTRVTA